MVQYLMFRARGADWESDWQSAVVRLLNDQDDVAVFGVVIRDVSPDQKDLEALAKKLDDGKPVKMGIELYAIYLPSGSIANLANHYASKKKKTTKRSPTKKVKKKTNKKKGGI